MKKVISFRLSNTELAMLDEVCARLGLSRSEAVATGISVLSLEYVRTAKGIEKNTHWLKVEDDAKH